MWSYNRVTSSEQNVVVGSVLSACDVRLSVNRGRVHRRVCQPNVLPGPVTARSRVPPCSVAAPLLRRYGTEKHCLCATGFLTKHNNSNNNKHALTLYT